MAIKSEKQKGEQETASPDSQYQEPDCNDSWTSSSSQPRSTVDGGPWQAPPPPLSR